MPRTFVYVRVSTAGQTADNQLREIAAAGFAVEPRRAAPRRAVAETISGSVAAARRPGFARLLGSLEAGDVLVVTRLDRLAATSWTSAPRRPRSPGLAFGSATWRWAASTWPTRPAG